MVQLKTLMSPTFLSRYRYAWLGQDEAFHSIASMPPTRFWSFGPMDAALCALQHKQTNLMSLQRRAGCSLTRAALSSSRLLAQ